MRENLRMLGIMTAFCLAAGLLLAWTFEVTRGPIAAARRQEEVGALKKVLPPADNDVAADRREIENGGTRWVFYVGRQGDTVSGVAYRTSAEGYGGPIELLVGLRADGTVNGVEVLTAEKETPGLGSKIRDPGFRAQFQDKRADDAARVAVRGDGGQIDAITGATISSRAMCKAVRAGLEVYARQAAVIKGDAQATP